MQINGCSSTMQCGGGGMGVDGFDGGALEGGGCECDGGGEDGCEGGVVGAVVGPDGVVGLDGWEGRDGWAGLVGCEGPEPSRAGDVAEDGPSAGPGSSGSAFPFAVGYPESWVSTGVEPFTWSVAEPSPLLPRTGLPFAVALRDDDEPEALPGLDFGRLESDGAPGEARIRRGVLVRVAPVRPCSEADLQDGPVMTVRSPDGRPAAPCSGRAAVPSVAEMMAAVAQAPAAVAVTIATGRRTLLELIGPCVAPSRCRPTRQTPVMAVEMQFLSARFRAKELSLTS